ncbi:efflux RND transporter periplasmic adaptor subunit [Planctomycetes bacterium K23_9]|uniref:Multidrug resistance protein MdtN n=1 Tax=Stieleria marina TaxID=1930275 RepID=A0A517NW92_9BACT|nr:Multidrug resistance protein MdtN [Planctomycetes bacterium K23_9]
MTFTESSVSQSPSESTPLIIPQDPPPKRKSTVGNFSAGMLFNVIIPIGLIAAGLVAVKLFGVATAPPRDVDDDTRAGRLKALAAVRVEKIRSLESTGEELQLVVDGTVVPFREAKIAAEVAGRVIEKSAECEAGSVVSKGDLLMKIDPTDYEIEVDRLTRLKEQEYQALQEIDQEKANTVRLIKVAQRDVDLQQKEVDRQESLPQGFASRGDIDRAKRALLQSEQQLVTTQNTSALLDKRRVRLEASEKLAATQLKAANLNLARTQIKAPIDGVIVTENADLNTFVSRGTVLLTIEDTSKVEVATSLRMDQLYWVLDQKHDATASGKGGYDLPDTDAIIQYDLTGRENESYQWKGRLLSYDGVGLDPQTRTVPVRVLVETPTSYRTEQGDSQSATAPSALLRGMYVQVKLLIKPTTPLVVIPGTALQPGNRVWQFSPDESVLEIPEAEQPKADEKRSAELAKNSEADVKAATADASPKDADAQDSVSDSASDSDTSFDPKQWTPGRVIVQKGVFPVDALKLTGSNTPEIEARYESNLAGERQFWVCEIRGDSFSKDSYVVTSPLSGVDAGGLAARAKLKPDADDEIKPDSESDSANESDSAAELGDAS